MKIKCPVKDCGMEVTERELLKHLLSYSTEKDKIRYIQNYVKLLVRIHEKIESFYKPDPPDYKPMFANDGIIKSIVIQVLESLLEDKK